MTLRPTIGATHVDGDVITAAQFNNDVVQQAQWAQEVLLGTNTDKIPVAGIAGVVGTYPNILVNGGMEINQRQAGVVTGNSIGPYVVDGWRLQKSGSSTVTAQQAGAIDTGSFQSVLVSYTHVAGGQGLLFQNIENYTEYRGKTLYVTARVYSSSGTGAYLYMTDSVTSGTSARVLGTGIVQTLTATINVNASAAIIQVAMVFDNAVSAVYVDSVMLAQAPVPIDYVPRPLAEEYLLCQRIYQKVRVSHRFWATAAAQSHDVPIIFPVQMAATPTVVSVAGSPVANLSSYSVADMTIYGARHEMVSAAAGDTYTIAQMNSFEVVQ